MLITPEISFFYGKSLKTIPEFNEETFSKRDKSSDDGKARYGTEVFVQFTSNASTVLAERLDLLEYRFK